MGKEQRNTTTDLIVTNDGQGKPSAEDNAIRENTVDSKDADSRDDLEKEGGKRKQKVSRKRRAKKRESCCQNNPAYRAACIIGSDGDFHVYRSYRFDGVCERIPFKRRFQYVYHGQEAEVRRV